MSTTCSDGVHIISIKAHECEHGYDAIGIITVKDISFCVSTHFPDNKVGHQYYYFHQNIHGVKEKLLLH